MDRYKSCFINPLAINFSAVISSADERPLAGQGKSPGFSALGLPGSGIKFGGLLLQSFVLFLKNCAAE
jgi:hypothetical protein